MKDFLTSVVVVLCFVDLLLACNELCVCTVNEDEVIVGVDCSESNLNELPELLDYYEVV